jgi:NAD-dependent deacetylase
MMTESTTDLPDWAYGVRKLVVFSGAGISTDSGIPDFRGPNGAWTLNPQAQHTNTYQAFMTDPQLRVSYWRSRYEHEVWEAEPNVGHLVVASLAGSEIDTTVVTQNTDGLHQLGGMSPERVIELHGTMRVTQCVQCGKLSATTDVLTRIGAGDPTPPCVQCGGILETASTMFGQTMSPEVFARAREAVSTCDLVLAVGTSLTVEPAGSLCATAVHAGAKFVIVNRDPTPYDRIATALIRESLGEALPRIVAQLRAGVDARSRVPSDSSDQAEDESRVARPSDLLRVTARTVTFQSRESELERLTAWCSGAGTRTHFVTGPAGVGKSRLALELADRLTASGEWDVAFLGPGADLPAGERSLLVVVEDAETRQAQVAHAIAAAEEDPAGRSIRVVLLARTHEGCSVAATSEELTPPGGPRVDQSHAVRSAATGYAAALTALGLPTTEPDRVFLLVLSGAPRLPGALQATVLAGLLGLAGPTAEVLVHQELTYLRQAAREQGLGLPAGAVADAAVTAILGGATDEKSALAGSGTFRSWRTSASASGSPGGCVSSTHRLPPASLPTGTSRCRVGWPRSWSLRSSPHVSS